MFQRACTPAILCVVFAPPAMLSASEPALHAQVDRLIAVGLPDFGSRAAERSSDDEFHRRVHLDVVGVIPTVDESRAFFADDDADKRTRLIDRLLADPRHARRMAYVFDAMLMERRPDKHVKTAEWREYLRHSFLENKPWDQLTLEILSADGVKPAERARARFLLDRELDVDQTVRDVGRLFLGRDLQCAQCHDHPAVGDYLQRHYFGLSAFWKRSYVFNDRKRKRSVIAEKADGEVTFASVFTNEKGATAPRMLDQSPLNDPADFKKAYVSKPSSKSRGVPVYSRRGLAASAVVNPVNRAFRRNIANRIWALAMGRGLVEPLDMHHADNPPSHPELLELLSNELHARGYDLRWMFRELLLTETYQRSSRLPSISDAPADDRFAAALQKPLTAEQFAWSMMQASGVVETQVETLRRKTLTGDLKWGAQLVADPAWRSDAMERAVSGSLAAFVNVFAEAGLKTGFDASADQALFLVNGSVVQSWLTARSGRLVKEFDDDGELIDELFLSVLSRPPTDAESADLAEYLGSEDVARKTAVREILWALLTSAEFRFNH